MYARWIYPMTVVLTVAAGCAGRQKYDQWFDMSPEQLRVAISTPEEAAEALDVMMAPTEDARAGWGDDWRSLAEVLARGEGDCDDFAVGSAALLRDDGYPAAILVVGHVGRYRDRQGGVTRKGASHAVHLLEKNGLYGCSGQNRWDRVEPQFATVADLVRHMPAQLGRWDFYKIIGLDEVDYLAGRGNLFDALAEQWKATPWVDVPYGPVTTQPVRRDRSWEVDVGF